MFKTKRERCVIINRALLFIGFLVSIQNFYAQDLPPIQYFSPKQYQAENQNWEISQGNDRHIFVANSKGLLEFNGAEWMLYPSPNQTIIRSVKVVKDKIYTGSYMEFGYWSKTKVGALIYTSLSKKIKNKLFEDEQFWKIINLDNWVLFQSLNSIYVYNLNTDSFKVIPSDAGIIEMFKVDNTIYYQDRAKGVLKLENGTPKLIDSVSSLKEKIIVGMYLLNNKLLIVTQNEGVFSLDRSGLKVWSNNLNKTLSNYSIYSSLKLKDDSLMFGTISNGLLQISRDGEVKQVINHTNGLANNTVLSIFEDRDSNIWLGLDNGINYINKNAPFKIFNDDKGVLGTVYASIIFNNTLYLGTNQGVFYKNDNETEFKPVKNTKGQVWSLKIIDNQLFCGHNSGTFLISNNEATKIASVNGTWDFKTIKKHPNLVLQGNYNGLNVLEKKEGSWQFRNKIEGFDNSSRFFVFSNANQIYVNHEYKGVFKIKIDADLRKVIDVSKVERLKKGIFSSLTEYDNTLYYATQEGIFKKGNTDASFVKDTVLSNLYEEQGYSSGKLIADQKTNTLWIITQKGLNYISPGKLSDTPEISFVPLSNSLREGLSGYESIFNIKPNVYLFGTSKGYITLDVSKIESKKYQVGINAIDKSPLSSSKTLVELTGASHFSNKENNFEFAYSVPEYDKYLEAEYSHKLEGLYDNWSTWSTEASILYKNLSYGDYVFKVKARVGGDDVENVAIYSFTIGKPWYLTNLMVVFYCFSGIVIGVLIHYFYKIYYRKQKEKLVLKSNRELELKDFEIRQQLMALNNEKLRQEIESKNRELAISTMSLIKKNEFLNTIKTELNQKTKDSNLKSVIKIIDKNINNKDDWNLFEEAFNNADKDFLKKVKSKHPVLTPNDLRLCAYLRLNLASKEIAPLLNISPRSVEVKRYRLRKKMELEHDVNLTDYILGI
ncbi:triple tyrosine motif-containing protein [Olleya sp. Bg11-27]|uniref:triple tyrosine motif-containing protein n=1 Tax=Olleya sp. Bg11-27 TaxID=2058135 RepID=UPI000C3023F0|nr:LuxR C-terminal-related transcriptional regulator [Olleya sp. Bg11-27]AUC76940.1 LuxR family transcriptional regulator [Olleya sp. Bg11-27]